jgi:hypothetical protein
MSDLELILEEIEALQSAISGAIYMAKKNGNIPELEKITCALGEVVDKL